MSLNPLIACLRCFYVLFYEPYVSKYTSDFLVAVRGARLASGSPSSEICEMESCFSKAQSSIALVAFQSLI